ncbi:hypothetical protein M5D96_001682 [Drosophila gunungcola]|uniref:Uncharacterized protein n=1 Tax=Drosophila gunungcola TaxID=103775 RepID=A0A9Q0BVK3_9MUSC|nr:hypothetical protein M5D96_001682 [Drosophila gunungcola]
MPAYIQTQKDNAWKYNIYVLYTAHNKLYINTYSKTPRYLTKFQVNEINFWSVCITETNLVHLQ